MNFPNEILNHITIRELLEKWLSLIYSDVFMALCKYHMKIGNIDAGDKKIVKRFFKDTYNNIYCLTPLLEDLVNADLHGIEDIFIAVFGILSDEVYVLRSFFKLYAGMDSWVEANMWDDCISDKRMLKILLN